MTPRALRSARWCACLGAPLLLLTSLLGWAAAPAFAEAAPAPVVDEQAVAALRVLDGRSDGSALVLGLPGEDPVPIGGPDAPLGYMLLPAGTVVATIASPAEESGPLEALVRVRLSLEPAAYHTLLVLEGPDAASERAVETLLLRDDLRSLPPAGMASLRLVHAAPPSGPLHFELVPVSSRGSTRDGGLEPAAAALPAVQLAPLEGGEPLLVPAGSYELALLHEDGRRLALPPARLELRANAAYSLYLFSVTDEALRTRLIVDASLPAPAQHPPG